MRKNAYFDSSIFKIFRGSMSRTPLGSSSFARGQPRCGCIHISLEPGPTLVDMVTTGFAKSRRHHINKGWAWFEATSTSASTTYPSASSCPPPPPFSKSWIRHWVQRCVQCSIRLLEIETGRRRWASAARQAACVDFVASATAWLEDPRELSVSFSHFFCVSSTFSSHYLTNRQLAAVVPVARLDFRRLRFSPGPRVFTRKRLRIFSQGRMSLATESRLGESRKTFSIEENKLAVLLGRARSRA